MKRSLQLLSAMLVLFALVTPHLALPAAALPSGEPLQDPAVSVESFDTGVPEGAAAGAFDFTAVPYETAAAAAASTVISAASTAASGTGAKFKALAASEAAGGSVLVAQQQYVVTVAAGATRAQINRITRTVNTLDGQVNYVATNSSVWKGVAITVPTSTTKQTRLLSRLLNNPQVVSVEPNLIFSNGPTDITAAAVSDLAATVSAQTTQAAPSWGLDRVDGKMGDGYKYTNAGAGVCVYVLDTGVATTHSDFGSRRLAGYYIRYATDKAGQTDGDYNGHGTHVAGTVAGSKYGVAKSAYIVPVRVLDNSGSGTTTSLVTGINWAVKHKNSKCSKKIINMSLGTTATSTAMVDAVKAATNAGVLVVVAAGNNAVDACKSSPANAPTAVTVGSTGQANAAGLDPMSPFSNYGSCVDVFAPENIVSDYFDSKYVMTASGTSMACPHVAGLAARLWSSGSCSSAATCAAKLLSLAQSGVVSGAGAGSPNKEAGCGRLHLSLLLVCPSICGVYVMIGFGCRSGWARVFLCPGNLPSITLWNVYSYR